MKRLSKALAVVALFACIGGGVAILAACSNSSDNNAALLALAGTGGGSGGQQSGGGQTGGGGGTPSAVTYTVTVADCSNGSVTANPTSAAQGATVTLTISPDSGYGLDTISAAAGSNPVDLSGTGNTRTFTMPAANVTVTAAFKSLLAGFVKVEGATIVGNSKFTNNGWTGVFVDGRTVTLSDFYMCDHEVTQTEYQAVMGSNPSNFKSDAADGETQGDRPVEKVSWYDALVYCNKKSLSENLTPCYTINFKTNPSEWGTVPTSSDPTWNNADCNLNANGYRLPTEAEWEYAALGGKAGVALNDPTDYAGTNVESELKNYAWYSDNSDSKTHAVKTDKVAGIDSANGLGIYDMSGNVWEWCWDWYDSDVTAGDNGNASVTNPLGALTGSDRVIRGGCWIGGDSDCSVAYRHGHDLPYRRNYVLGFRVVRSAN